MNFAKILKTKILSKLFALVVLASVAGGFSLQAVMAATSRTGETVAANTVYKGETNVEALKFYLTVDSDTTLGGIAPAAGTAVSATEDADWDGGAATTDFFFYDKTNIGAWDSLNDWMGFDLDKDGVYTTAADTIIDADGTVTIGADTPASDDTKAAGDILTNFDGSDNVFVTGGNSIYDGGGEALWLDLDNDGVVTTIADTIIHNGTDAPATGATLFDVTDSDQLCSDNIDGTLALNIWTYTDDGVDNTACTADDAVGIAYKGAATAGILIGTATNWAATDETLDAETDLYKEETSGELTFSSGADGAILGALPAAATASVELDGASNLVYNDEGGVSGVWDSGEDIILENYSGEKTWSAAADTTFAGVAIAAGAGTAISDTKDTDWTTVRFYDKTASNPWDVDNDWIGIDSDGYYLDQLNAITAQLDSGSTATYEDIAAVKFWMDTDNDGAFEPTTDDAAGALGTGTWDLASQNWYLSSLTRSLVGGTANRIFVSVDIAASPTNGATIKMKVPTYAGSAPFDIDEGDVGIYLASSRALGLVTNTNSITIDASVPTVSIESSEPALKIGETATISFTLSEDSTNFIADDVTVVGGTISALSGSGHDYTATFTPTDVNVTAASFHVDADKFTDAAGNGNSLSDTEAMTVDLIAPTANFGAATDNAGTVTGALDEGDTTDDTSLVLSGTNEAGSTVNVYNGLVLVAAATVDGTTWSYTATIADATTYEFNVKETDLAGNTSAATTDFTVIGDMTAPTLTSAIFTDPNLKVSETSVVTFTFSEVVTGLTTEDLTVADGSGVLTDVAAGSGTTWTATFTPTDDLESATNVIAVDMTGVTDAAGNPGEGSTDSSNYAIDTKEPTLVSAAFTGGNQITVTYSEPVISANTDYTWLLISAGGHRTVTAAAGTGTATITLTFSGTAVNSAATATMSIGSTVTDVATNALAALDGQVVTAEVGAVTPTIALIGDAIVNSYTVSEADDRFETGLQFTIGNNASVTVNGAVATPVGATLTAATHDAAQILGNHAYNVRVTSITGDTVEMDVSYQVKDDALDTTPPTITRTVPETLASQYKIVDVPTAFTWTLAGTNALSKFYVNGVDKGVTSPVTYTLLAGTDNTLGAHIFNLELVDVNGNRATGIISYNVVDNDATDDSHPTIEDFGPDDGAAINSYVFVLFSEVMDRTTCTAANVHLWKTSGEDAEVAINEVECSSTFTLDGVLHTAMYVTPTDDLAYGTTYSLVVDNTVTDWYGNAFEGLGLAIGDYSFTTVAAASVPHVEGQTPENGTVDVAINELPTVTFSEEMDISTVNSVTVQLRNVEDDVQVDALITQDATDPLTFIINPDVDYSGHYYIYVSGAKNLAGTTVTTYGSKTTTGFTYVAYSDTPPVIESFLPANNASIGVSVGPNQNPVSLTFNTLMWTETLTTANIKLFKNVADGDDVEVASTIMVQNGADKTIVQIIPAADLDYGSEYYVTVNGNVEDYAHSDALIATWTSANSGNHHFHTDTIGTGSLRVDNVLMNEAKRMATVGGGYGQGWEWNISLTVPTAEPKVQLKFGNFGSIPAGTNVRYFSAQDKGGHAAEGEDTTITATGNGYPDTYLVFDNTSDTQTGSGNDGYQVVVTVQVKIPADTAAGSYAGQFQVRSTAHNDATVTSEAYTVSALESGSGTITGVPSGTSKDTFLAALTKGQADQTWDSTGIADPVVTEGTLVVTAQDGTTVATYTVTVDAE
jgi:hypothetical protein